MAVLDDAPPAGFDLTPTDDQRALVDVVSAFADEVVRPAAAVADDSCAAPVEVLDAAEQIGLSLVGVPERLGGIADEHPEMTGVLVHEALARGDMGLAVAALRSGAVATALARWGTPDQQVDLTAVRGSLALAEPRVSFDGSAPATTATRSGSGFLVNGVKSLVAGGTDADVFVVGARLEDRPALFVVPSGDGVRAAPDPAMGVRAAGFSRLTLTNAAGTLLGADDGSTYAEAVRGSRLAWCALAIGTGQAVLDYVTPYVKQREAFGEPIGYRQSVAFMVADMAIELQAMRLVTYRAGSRLSRGEDARREVGLAHRLCSEKGMRIGLDGVQLLGGHGFVKEHPVERWYRDLRAIGVIEGSVLV